MRWLLPLCFLLPISLSLAWWPSSPIPDRILPGAEQVHLYQHFLKGRRIGLIVNHTSTIGQVHLVDSLLRLDAKIIRIFAPEHGFRGEGDAGEKIGNSFDPKTKIPIVSVYGKSLEPRPEDLQDLDLLIFDIQDVGVRFYTYTSTMTYMMKAAARQGIDFLVLDRPNPNGHYVDGPVLKDKNLRSFVGLHPVPIVHGLTVAEYARMINEEGWLGEGLRCQLYYVACANYRHSSFYEPPIPPSPNLKTLRSIYLYPSLCLFEGTNVSLGRGTKHPFEVYGLPDWPEGPFAFTPQPSPGAKNPPHKGIRCYGYDLSASPLGTLQQEKQFKLEYLWQLYHKLKAEQKANFFSNPSFFDQLAGNTQLRAQIQQGLPIEAIRQSWQSDLAEYGLLRQKYLLYPE
jgi:uncharacterized protein YbbC (DUF1343 family)